LITQHVLIIGSIWVEPNSSAAGSRMMQLIEQFLNKNWKVTFVSSAQKSKKALDLNSLGITEATIELNNASFDQFIKQLQPTIVLFDRFMIEEQFGWRVAENCPNAIRILDTEDLHFLRKVRHQQYKKGECFTTDALLKSDETKREIASILRCDINLIISTFEMELLKNTFKIDDTLLYYLPFLLDKIGEHQTKKWKPFKEREHFIFIGNFFHKPNIDAVLTLKNYIWKSIKKQLPNAEMHIYGAYVNQQIQQLQNKKEGFIIKGFAENATKVVLNAKVVLAPLNFGAGIKGKLTEAMICGTPSVTTKIGAEGMHNNLSWNGFITNDYGEFVKKSVTLYIDQKIWENSQKNGIEIINLIYNKENLGDSFIKKIEDIQENLVNHRTQNFLGSLIQHQTLQATKYLSKWIESKKTPH
jgi:glycosyltransferase involved in cell wall biosynthesis